MVVTLHEQGASYMATCFSHINGKGCCVGMTGPGTMNLINGVAVAYTDSVPLLVIGGQTPVEDTGKYAIQESTGIGRTPNQMKVMQAVSKHAIQVRSSTQLLSALREGYLISNTGRKGPVFIEIPQNVLQEDIEIKEDDLFVDLTKEYSIKKSDALVNTEKLRKATSMIRSSTRPLLLLGNGAQIANAENEAMELVEHTGIPFATSLPAKGLLNEDHELSLGCLGIWGQKAANDYILNHADVLIAVGTTFQELSTLGWRSLKNKKIIRVDIDPDELTRNINPDLSVLSDAKIFLADILNEFASNQTEQPIYKNFREAREKIKDLKEKHGYYETISLADYSIKENDDRLQPYDVLIELSKLRSPQDIIVLDVGENAYFSQFLVKSYSRKTYIVNAGLGSMGFAAPGAVGISMANPEATVISISGDGGFLMMGNDISTGASYNCKVVWCVLNNGILGTQKHYQRDYCDGRYIGCHLPDIDITEYARSLGVDAVTITNIKQFREEFQAALQGNKPRLLNIVISNETSPKPPFFF